MTHMLHFEKIQSLNFTIGAATQATSVSGDVIGTANGGSSGATSYASGGNGGSGGGGGGTDSTYNSGKPGTGDGKSKYPFGITSLQAHCAGGAGGGVFVYTYFIGESPSYTYGHGGNGGSNGSGGGAGSSSGGVSGGTGGVYGGGNGGDAPDDDWDIRNGVANGKNATFYGGGGGGGGGSIMYDGETDWSGNGSGGSGYQGVAYVIDGLFPANV